MIYTFGKRMQVLMETTESVARREVKPRARRKSPRARHRRGGSDPWTWAWYWGRVKCELRYVRRSLVKVVRRESRWYAPTRALFHALVLMYECEICEVCGHPVAAVWHAEDALWLKVNGKYGGLMCASCFNKEAERAGFSPYWEVHDGEFPTCTGSPCVHVAPMMIQSKSATEYWDALVEVTGSRDAACEIVARCRAAYSQPGSAE